VLSIADASQRERAAAAALQSLSRSLIRDINKATATVAIPLVRAEVSARAPSSTARQIAASARTSNFKGVPGVAFGGSSAVTSSGATGRQLVRGLEHGSRALRSTTYLRRGRSGSTHKVTRNALAQFRPQQPDQGAFIGAGALAASEDVLAAWLDVVETAVVAALNGGTSG
jgi:hypothetical protein